MTGANLAPADPTLAEPAAPDLDLPTLAAPLPDRLAVSVHDPLGDWSVDLFRHDGALDLLFRGDTELAAAVHAAEVDIRAALADAGQSLGLLEYSQGSETPAGHGRPHPHDPRPAGPNAPSPGARADASGAPEPRRAVGRRVDRVA